MPLVDRLPADVAAVKQAVGFVLDVPAEEIEGYVVLAVRKDGRQEITTNARKAGTVATELANAIVFVSTAFGLEQDWPTDPD